MRNGHPKFLLGISIILGFILCVPAFADKTGSDKIDIEFTFDPYLSVDFSSNALIIDNLSPSTFNTSAPANITIQTNNLTGYTMFATVGNATHASRQLENASPSITGNNFDMVVADTADASLQGKQWGYRKVTGSNTASGTWVPTANMLSGLPLYTDSGDGATISSSTVGPISHTIPFIIGARSADNHAAGTYENVINFTVVANTPSL